MADRFVDIYAPSSIKGYPCVSTPRWNTTMTGADSGDEVANQNWANPLYRFTLPDAIRDHTAIEALKDHWMVMRGPFHLWPFRDPLDFASVPLECANVVPAISGADQALGVGDGVETQFQLRKVYQVGSQSYSRRIYLPVTSSVVLEMNGLDPTTPNPTLPGGPYSFTVDRTTGVVTFTAPPVAGVVLTAGFLFDVAVRFEADDSFDGVVQSYQVSGNGQLTLLEKRIC